MPTLRVGKEENIGEIILLLIYFVQYSSTCSFFYVPFIITNLNRTLLPLSSPKKNKINNQLDLNNCHHGVRCNINFPGS